MIDNYEQKLSTMLNEANSLAAQNDIIHTMHVSRHAIKNCLEKYRRECKKLGQEEADNKIIRDQVIQRCELTLTQMRYWDKNGFCFLPKDSEKLLEMAKKSGYNFRWSNEKQKMVKWY